MSTISHRPTETARKEGGWAMHLRIPEMWAALAIGLMWLAVAVDAISGPNVTSSSGVAGVGDSTTIPSAVVLALFAFLGTWVVAYFGFGHRRDED